MRTLALAVLLLIPDSASAQGFGVRITQEGAQQIRDLALERLPPVYSTPQYDAVVFNCPGDGDTTGHVPPTDIGIGWHSLDFRIEDGRFYAGTVIDIDVATPITIDNAYACLGTSTCDITANVRSLGVEIELAASSAADGTVQFDGAMVDLALTPEDLNLESANCISGEIVTWLFNTFESWALSLAIPALERMMSERMSAAMEDMLDQSVGLAVMREDMSIRGWLDDISLSSTVGMTMTGSADLMWTGTPAYDDPAPPVSDAEGEALPADFGPGAFQLAVSDRIVTEALYEAWRGGMITQLLADRSLSIDLGADGPAQQLGLQEGTSLDISFDIERPLAATFGRVAPNVATIDLQGLHVHIDVMTPSGESSAIDIRVDGALQAGLGVDGDLGGVVLDLVDLDIASLSIEAGDNAVVADRARLRAFVENTVTPMLAARISGVPVAPALHSVLGTFIDIRTIESEGGWQRLGVDLVNVDTSDTQAPDTTLTDPSSLLPVGTATFMVSGSDDTTPERLLRYFAWLDGEPLNGGVASSIRAIRADVTGGVHTLEVAAIDLNDNEDATAVSHTFTVDALPPTLTIIDPPSAIHSSRTVSLAWEAADEGGGVVESSWQVRIIDQDGTARVVQEESFLEGRFELETEALQPGSLYEIEVTVRDRAGNLTSETVGFAIDPSLDGCSASPGGRSVPAFGFLVLALAALWIRRR